MDSDKVLRPIVTKHDKQKFMKFLDRQATGTLMNENYEGDLKDFYEDLRVDIRDYFEYDRLHLSDCSSDSSID